MSTALHLTLEEYSRMVARGAFEAINRKVELIRGVIVEMNPAGPVHDDLVRNTGLSTYGANAFT